MLFFMSNIYFLFRKLAVYKYPASVFILPTYLINCPYRMKGIL